MGIYTDMEYRNLSLSQITLDTTHPSVSLRSLFPTLLLSPRSTQEGEGGETAPHNVLGFKLLAGPVVTIVGSKSSERYRVQSESLPATAMFLEELVSRLEDYHRGKVSPGFTFFVPQCPE